MTNTLANCCELLDPCEALCLMQNAYNELMIGKKHTKYKLGEEEFTIAITKASDLRSAIDYYRGLCDNASITEPLSRKRAQALLVPTVSHVHRRRRGCYR